MGCRLNRQGLCIVALCPCPWFWGDVKQWPFYVLWAEAAHSVNWRTLLLAFHKVDTLHDCSTGPWIFVQEDTWKPSGPWVAPLGGKRPQFTVEACLEPHWLPKGIQPDSKITNKWIAANMDPHGQAGRGGLPKAWVPAQRSGESLSLNRCSINASCMLQARWQRPKTLGGNGSAYRGWVISSSERAELIDPSSHHTLGLSLSLHCLSDTGQWRQLQALIKESTAKPQRLKII